MRKFTEEIPRFYGIKQKTKQKKFADPKENKNNNIAGKQSSLTSAQHVSPFL